MNWQRWYRAVIISIMLALLFALALPITGQSAEDSPLIHHASVQPAKVRPGDTMTVTAEVSDSSGIESVTADMGGIETVSLSLIEGSIYDGTWQGQWLVHDTTARDYVTTIVATNSLGKSATRDVLWRDPQTYERYHNTYKTEQTTTSTTWQDAHSITFTPNVTGNFTVISSATLQNDSTSDYTEVQVIYDSTVINTRQFMPALTTEKCTFGTHDVILLTGGTPYTFKAQYRTGPGGGTARISDCRFNIFAVSDYHHTEGATANTTAETYQNAATLTFTPATAGDYLIIASAEIAYGSTGESFLAQLYYNTGSISWGEMSRQPIAANEYQQYHFMRKQNLAAAEHTFYIQYRRQTGGTSTVYIRRARITAIRASDLGDVEYTEAETETSTNSVTYQLVATLNWDPITYGNYMRFGCRFLTLDKTNKFAWVAIYEDTVLKLERDMQPNATTDYIPLWGGLHRFLDNTAHTVEHNYKSSSAAAYAYIKNTRIFMIRADTLNPFEDSVHTTYCNNFNSSSLDTVYIQGCYFAASDNFTTAYYDGGGTKVMAENKMSDANGVLDSQWYFPGDTGAAPGTWHAVVYDNDVATPALTYTANDPNSVRECTFEVTAAAIPEFPTVMAAIMVAGLCFGIYYWMRKRRLAYVKA